MTQMRRTAWHLKNFGFMRGGWYTARLSLPMEFREKRRKRMTSNRDKTA